MWGQSFLLVLFALPARAPSILPNPRFDGTLDPRIPFLTICDGDHSATADGAGSAVSVTDTNDVVQRCVSPIFGGVTCSFDGRVGIPSRDLRAGHAPISVE